MERIPVKRVLSAFMVLVVMLSLCACDSSDYKKAMALFNNGEYAEASEIFAALGDYEDAPEMTAKCEYALAVELVESGDYEAAVSAFDRLGDYQESAKYSKQAKWGMLYNYIQEHGEEAGDAGELALSAQVEHGSTGNADIYIYAADPDTLTLEQKYSNINSGYGITENFTITIERESENAEWNGKLVIYLSGAGYSGGSSESGSGVINLSTWTPDSEFVIDTYQYYCKALNGEEKSSIDPNDQIMLVSTAVTSFSNIISGFSEIIAQSDLPITIADLGFTAMV